MDEKAWVSEMFGDLDLFTNDDIEFMESITGTDGRERKAEELKHKMILFNTFIYWMDSKLNVLDGKLRGLGV